MPVLRTASGQGALLEVAQVHIDIVVAIAGPVEPTGECATSIGAVACRWLRAAVACPHQPILLVIAEALRLAAP